MCGIAAFLGNEDGKIDQSIMNFLLVSQDTRGKDNCGFMYTVVDESGKNSIKLFRGSSGAEFGGEDTSSFKKLLKWRKGLYLGGQPNFRKSPILIGHSRSISRGSNSITNAHPFVCYDNKENPTRTLVGVHNGTITNLYSIKNNFDLKDFSDKKTDSELIFTIMARSWEETIKVLSYYEGSAALVWHIKEEPNKVYVWVGKNEITTWNKEDQERPLHMIETTQGIYISSEDTPIENAFLLSPNRGELLVDNNIEIFTFKTNAITVIESGVVVDIIDVDRTKAPVKTLTYGYGDDEYNYQYTNRNAGKEKGRERKINEITDNCLHNSCDSQKEDKLPISVLKKDIHTPAEIDKFNAKCKLYLQYGLYHLKGKLASTKYEIDNGFIKADFEGLNLYQSSTGMQICRERVDDTNEFRYYPLMGSKEVKVADMDFAYFYSGVLLKGKSYFDDLVIEKAAKGRVSAKLLRECSAMPIPSFLFLAGAVVDGVIQEKVLSEYIVVIPKFEKDGTSKILQGDIKYKFSDKTYTFNKGIVTNISNGENDTQLNLFENAEKLYALMCHDCMEQSESTSTDACKECGSINVTSVEIDSKEEKNVESELSEFISEK